MDGFPSGQREQTVNLPAQLSVVRIHPRPPNAVYRIISCYVGRFYLEAYRSGHNGPHSKCGNPQGFVSSNLTASAKWNLKRIVLKNDLISGFSFVHFKQTTQYIKQMCSVGRWCLTTSGSGGARLHNRRTGNSAEIFFYIVINLKKKFFCDIIFL